MSTFLGLVSAVCWLAVAYNETIGAVTGKLWLDNTFMLWTALLFAVWALAWTVNEKVKAEKEAQP